jgi:hypothetical protein
MSEGWRQKVFSSDWMAKAVLFGSREFNPSETYKSFTDCKVFKTANRKRKFVVKFVIMFPAYHQFGTSGYVIRNYRTLLSRISIFASFISIFFSHSFISNDFRFGCVSILFTLHCTIFVPVLVRFCYNFLATNGKLSSEFYE